MEFEIKKSVNLTGVICPMNFVKTKVALSTVESGDIIEVILDEGDALLNVPRSVKDEGHSILKVIPNEETFRVIIKKK